MVKKTNNKNSSVGDNRTLAKIKFKKIIFGDAL
jgi:hypothetical protein